MRVYEAGFSVMLVCNGCRLLMCGGHMVVGEGKQHS